MGALVTVHFRQERPPFSASYRETARLAQHFGWAIPAQKAARRWIAPKRMLRSVIPHWDRDHAFEAAVREFAQKSIGREQIDDVEPFFAGKHRLHRRLPSPWP
ncbi:DNA-binding domain-containing protein [Gemmobacter sp. 24YEA27]|uniref:DNA-binding domain-containing protein n=1 Tax=Gemmobacter sp. 24YEA27 TaxID=3040672 RepID=UPI0024B3BC1A|nr:DNA-binding domain-containing protein [Gemmobacter sp. 24YEA27]